MAPGHSSAACAGYDNPVGTTHCSCNICAFAFLSILNWAPAKLTPTSKPLSPQTRAQDPTAKKTREEEILVRKLGKKKPKKT